MGPTNSALVNLFHADQQLRDAQGRLAAVTKNVRIQERRVHDQQARLDELQQKLQQQQKQSAALDMELKVRDQRIEKFRAQQQQTKNNREYQALLVQINTDKVDRNKIEEAAMKVLEISETDSAAIKELSAQLTAEREKLATMQSQVEQKVAELNAEINTLQPARDAVAAAASPRAVMIFDRLAERFDGDVMAPLSRLGKGREEYVCGNCNVELVPDIYNRLETRDEPVACPSCQRLLFIPESLTPDVAINKKAKARRSPRGGGSSDVHEAAAVARQSSAVDVLKSIQVEDEQSPESAQ